MDNKVTPVLTVCLLSLGIIALAFQMSDNQSQIKELKQQVISQNETLAKRVTEVEIMLPKIQKMFEVQQAALNQQDKVNDTVLSFMRTINQRSN